MPCPPFPLGVAVTEVLRAPLVDRAIGTRNSDFVIHEIRSKAGDHPRGGIPLHRHRTEDEAWYVLEGTLRFQYDAREFDAPAGAGVVLPKGIPHTFWNPGPGPARYLLIVGPKTEGLLEVLHAPERATPGSRKEVYDSFDVDLLE
jgi:mannose-6-phosphate isomerase-like protein (cupin superfamily)